MDQQSLLLAKSVKEKILENFLEYLKIFTPFQSEFLSVLYKRYKCLDSANLVLYFAKKTHQEILRKKEYDLDYDLSFEKFWENHSSVTVSRSTIMDIAKEVNLPKETARRKLSELIKQKVLSKRNRSIFWLPSYEYKQSYNQVVSEEIKQLGKLTKYVTDSINLNISREEIDTEYRKRFSFYWFHYLDLQTKWMRMWKSRMNDLELVLMFMQIATLLTSRVKEDVSHNQLFSKPEMLRNPGEASVSISATSISDVTGIPRATCIRKLNQMTRLKLVTQDKNSKRYFIVPEALSKKLVSKDLTENVIELFSNFYFICIKAINSKLKTN